MANAPKLLGNGWLTGSPVPDICSSGNSPDFLDDTSGQLYTCVGGKYVELINSSSGSQMYVSRYSYRADTSSTGNADPGKGKLRWNNIVQSSATEMYIDRLTTDGTDFTLQLILMGPASRFILQDPTFALNYQLWELTSPGVVSADYFVVPCHFISANGASNFSNNNSILILR